MSLLTDRLDLSIVVASFFDFIRVGYEFVIFNSVGGGGHSDIDKLLRLFPVAGSDLGRLGWPVAGPDSRLDSSDCLVIYFFFLNVVYL